MSEDLEGGEVGKTNVAVAHGSEENAINRPNQQLLQNLVDVIVFLVEFGFNGVGVAEGRDLYHGSAWGDDYIGSRIGVCHKLDLGEGVEYFWEYGQEEEAKVVISEVRLHGCGIGIKKK